MAQRPCIGNIRGITLQGSLLSGLGLYKNQHTFLGSIENKVTLPKRWLKKERHNSKKSKSSSKEQMGVAVAISKQLQDKSEADINNCIHRKYGHFI